MIQLSETNTSVTISLDELRIFEDGNEMLARLDDIFSLDKDHDLLVLKRTLKQIIECMRLGEFRAREAETDDLPF